MTSREDNGLITTASTGEANMNPSYDPHGTISILTRLGGPQVPIVTFTSALFGASGSPAVSASAITSNSVPSYEDQPDESDEEYLLIVTNPGTSEDIVIAKTRHLPDLGDQTLYYDPIKQELLLNSQKFVSNDLVIDHLNNVANDIPLNIGLSAHNQGQIENTGLRRRHLSSPDPSLDRPRRYRFWSMFGRSRKASWTMDPTLNGQERVGFINQRIYTQVGNYDQWATIYRILDIIKIILINIIGGGIGIAAIFEDCRGFWVTILAFIIVLLEVLHLTFGVGRKATENKEYSIQLQNIYHQVQEAMEYLTTDAERRRYANLTWRKLSHISLRAFNSSQVSTSISIVDIEDSEKSRAESV